MDSFEREQTVRQYAERILHNPTRAQLEEVVTAITKAWGRDHQETHERAYQNGAEGNMA